MPSGVKSVIYKVQNLFKSESVLYNTMIVFI